MKRARLTVAKAMIVESLHLPIGTKIVDASSDGLYVEFEIEHPDFPDLMVGETIPRVTCHFQRFEQRIESHYSFVERGVL